MKTHEQEYVERQQPLTWHWLASWGFTWELENGPGRELHRLLGVYEIQNQDNT